MLFDGFSSFMRSKAWSLLFILLGLTSISPHLASAAPRSDNLDSHRQIIARDDYPSDYPYPKKDDCSAKVKTEADKSLFYTGYGGYGLTPKQMIAYKKQAGLHVVGDGFTYPSGFVVRMSWSLLHPHKDLRRLYFGGIRSESSVAWIIFHTE